MKKHFLSLSGLLVLMLSLAAGAQATFSENKATLSFPETVTFSTKIQSDVQISNVVLEYGVDQLTCGNVVGKAFPEFTPGKTLSVSWQWNMRQSGSIPPGAELWWRWVVTDSNGNKTTSLLETITWLDSLHSWQVLTGERINLHWYEGNQDFGKTLHTVAVDALKRLDADIGAQVDKPIDLYIYGEIEDMRDAVLYEPGWTGGEAFPPFNIVIIGINEQSLDWGKQAEAHELTHVVTGHMTFNCLWSTPSWLDEGLARYSEGKLDASSQDRFDKAVRDDTLLTLRSLSGGFSEKSDKADLSYSESYSVVKFLLETYGRNKMTSLLKSLQTGDTIDNALQTTYGFDTDGLEDAWRAGIGAKARTAGAATPTPIPSDVPTIQPVSGIPGKNITPVATPAVALLVTQASDLPEVTATLSPTATAQPAQGFQDSNLIIGIIIAASCLLALVVVIIVVVIVLVRRNGRQNEAQQ